MQIHGLDGMTGSDLQAEIDRGGMFVIYQYCISVVVLTFRRSSGIYFIRGGQSKVVKGIPFVLISLFLGWWGIPWGPIYTIGSLATNFRGGKNVTQEVLQSLAQ
jgi:hypothetical protein